MRTHFRVLNLFGVQLVNRHVLVLPPDAAAECATGRPGRGGAGRGVAIEKGRAFEN